VKWRQTLKHGLGRSPAGRALALPANIVAGLLNQHRSAARWLLANVPIRLPLETCIGFMGFPFDQSGWHHLIETLKEYVRNPSLGYQDSSLYRFHAKYQPANMAEALLLSGPAVRFRPALGVFPWGGFRDDSDGARFPAKDWGRSRFCGPTPEHVIQDEFARLCAVFESIRSAGYTPWRNSFIGGTFIRRRDGALRYIVLQGNHRMAAMAFLGYSSVLVRGLKGYRTVIDERDLTDWRCVCSGECSVEDARTYLNAYFTLDGHEQARRFELTEHA
jgi:hypothetical protein